MTSQRKIVSDAVFMVFYIGLVGAMACLTMTLVITHLVGFELTLPHTQMAAMNLAGWALLPFAVKIYQPMTGAAFTWRSNPILDGAMDH
jgi:hypothetical protein